MCILLQQAQRLSYSTDVHVVFSLYIFNYSIVLMFSHYLTKKAGAWQSHSSISTSFKLNSSNERTLSLKMFYQESRVLGKGYAAIR